jgi:hypothetical protein
MANVLRAIVPPVYKSRRNSFACHGKFEEQNKVLELSIIIVNYMLVICNAYYVGRLHPFYRPRRPLGTVEI